MTKEKELETCGCGEEHDHDHHHDTVTLTLEDGSELECPIIDIFEVEAQQYIALYHPIDEVALLYRFSDYEDGTIEVTSIESDEEFAKVSEYVTSLMEE
ncbi:DUF1292 domain-containing protein [Acidaminobacter sp. JC074]|uniref:DUF1292 domain-containing protein n=1 Tax=Acidaminobacter sp. JC074 TaxID=2530199 RepID=UPI001F0FA3B5|nr:DUF1292 domain-containing protein [Acidaminobacter sp. JC074]MCH4886491.1 DUF1292 domain-containing protein [Acidaminobacter sp. JC074]